MAQTLQMKNCTRSSRVRSAPVRCEASSSRVNVANSLKLAPAMLAAVIAANTGVVCLDLVAPRPVHADTEEENLTPYERRQRELERRRELLRQAREKALEKASSVGQQESDASEKATQAVLSANESRSSEVSKLSSDLKASAESYRSQASSSSRKLEPAPAPPVSDVPWWQSTAEPSPVTPAPTPAPITPAPVTPAPSAATEAPWWETTSKTEVPKVPEPKVAAVKAPEPKPAPVEQSKPGKRKGPLPDWLAEFIVLGSLVGTAVAFTKYLDETTVVLKKYTKQLEDALLNLKVPTLGGN